MNNKKKLNNAIKSAREANKTASIMLKDADSNDGYMKVIIAYLKIILEHHRSIVELTNVRQLSALALLRPTYEAYIRTIWLSTCLSDKSFNASMQLIHDVEDGKFPTLKIMCEDIDEIKNKTASFQHINAYVRDLENNKKLFHSFTHGGAELVAIAGSHHYRYTYVEMINILEVTTSYLSSAVYASIAIAGNLALAKEAEALILAKWRL